MEELIKQIIEIEEKAQAVVRDAKQADTELMERVKADSIKLRDDIEKKTQQKNEAVKQLEEDEADKKISEINAQTEKHMSELEEKYRQNKDKWVEDIFKGVIGG